MVFNLRLYTKGRAIWTANKGTGLRDWRWVLVVLYVSCVTIMVSIPRATLLIVLMQSRFVPRTA